MKPDAKLYNPAPDYLRALIAQSGLSQREAARRIGVDERLFRAYLADRASKSARTAEYTVQFALESLVQD
jgi:transcriptional regulator with XRE-family HTH domain